jgi:hypothetical protein
LDVAAPARFHEDSLVTLRIVDHRQQRDDDG